MKTRVWSEGKAQEREVKLPRSRTKSILSGERKNKDDTEGLWSVLHRRKQHLLKERTAVMSWKTKPNGVQNDKF